MKNMCRYILSLLMALLFGHLAAQTPWPDSLNTAKNVPYLTEQEKAVIFEMNKARTNPKRYATEVVAAMKLRFTDSESNLIYLKNDGSRIMTAEGVKVIDECIAEMNRTKPLGLLYPSQGLSKASRDHAREQAKSGATGHNSGSGASPWDRMDRYGRRVGFAGENLDYGNKEGVDVVLSLLIDDGVTSRGHRHNILSANFGMAGVAIATHPQYGHMCVIDYATRFVDK